MMIPVLQQTDQLPRHIYPSQVEVGDVVRFDSEPLPVVITSALVQGGHRVFEYVTEIRKSNGDPVFEGAGVHDPGETILLLHRLSGGEGR